MGPKPLPLEYQPEGATGACLALFRMARAEEHGPVELEGERCFGGDINVPAMSKNLRESADARSGSGPDGSSSSATSDRSYQCAEGSHAAHNLSGLAVRAKTFTMGFPYIGGHDPVVNAVNDHRLQIENDVAL
jgi:hypothetical protein